MKTRHEKNFLWVTMLLLIGIIATSSVEPGYDEYGNDIDECAHYGACPAGYECRNLPGSYMCVGDGIELECDNSGSDLVVHVIYATCVGISNPICQAKCVRCPRVYKACILGRAENIHGTCVCGSTSFSAY